MAFGPRVQAALRKLQPNPETLTPIHSDFLQLCILSKCYNAANQLLSEDIHSVDPHRTAVVPTDLLLYCYYGGMVCTARKQYAQALELYLQARFSGAGCCCDTASKDAWLCAACARIHRP